MTCFGGLESYFMFGLVCCISALVTLGLYATVKFQSFKGKNFFALCLGALIWTITIIHLGASPNAFACSLQRASTVLLGESIVSLAWCFFIFSYVNTLGWLQKGSTQVVLHMVLLASFAFIATNQWHKLIYTDAITMLPGHSQTLYAPSLGLYAIFAILCGVSLIASCCILKAFTKTKFTTWPLLILLLVITVTPSLGNATNVIAADFAMGPNPILLIFMLSILFCSWILLANQPLDTSIIAQSALSNCRFMREHTYTPRISEVKKQLNLKDSDLKANVILHDSIENLAAKSAMNKALHAADEANRVKNEFISVINHELRTPLTSISGGLSLALSGRLGEIDAPVLSLLKLSHRNSLRLAQLIDNILLTQKINSDELDLQNQSVHLDQVLEKSVEANQVFATERGITLNINNSNVNTAVSMIGDVCAVRQIIDNLISNAIKFSKEKTTVKCGVKVAEGQTILTIKNIGCGIPAGMEKRVFGRFEQAKENCKTYTQGSGLGLYISKALAQKMAGDIHYESEVGASTTFYVTFPLAESNDHIGFESG